MSFLYRLKDLKAKIIEGWSLLVEANGIPGDSVPQATQEQVDKARDEFQAIIREGWVLNPQPYVNPGQTKGRKQRTPAANLLDRLEKHPDDWIRFFLDFRVWDNNTIAERSFRSEKVADNVEKMIRSLQGGKDRGNIRSVIDTSQKHKLPPIIVLNQMYEGCTPDEVFHDPLPWYMPLFDPLDPRSPYYKSPWKMLPDPKGSAAGG